MLCLGIYVVHWNLDGKSHIQVQIIIHIGVVVG
jgi:hypothetical protein